MRKTFSYVLYQYLSGTAMSRGFFILAQPSRTLYPFISRSVNLSTHLRLKTYNLYIEYTLFKRDSGLLYWYAELKFTFLECVKWNNKIVGPSPLMEGGFIG